jgi:hypothetical protein
MESMESGDAGGLPMVRPGDASKCSVVFIVLIVAEERAVLLVVASATYIGYYCQHEERPCIVVGEANSLVPSVAPWVGLNCRLRKFDSKQRDSRHPLISP